jgi:hypothetical protein
MVQGEQKCPEGFKISPLTEIKRHSKVNLTQLEGEINFCIVREKWRNWKEGHRELKC